MITGYRDVTASLTFEGCKHYSLVTVPSPIRLHVDVPLIENLLEIRQLPIRIRTPPESTRSTVKSLVMEVEYHLELFVGWVGISRVGCHGLSTGCFADTASRSAFYWNFNKVYSRPIRFKPNGEEDSRKTVIVLQNLLIHLLDILVAYFPVDREVTERLEVSSGEEDGCVRVFRVFTDKVDLKMSA